MKNSDDGARCNLPETIGLVIRRRSKHLSIRRGATLKKVARIRGFVSPRLEIRLEPLEGHDNLIIIGRDGQPSITPQEMSRRRALAERSAENAALRADNAERRAENAALRAENAELRADQYAAKLRELGSKPD